MTDITSQQRYTLTCSNAAGSRSDSVTVNVEAEPTPTPTPNATPLPINVTLSEPDYCTLGPGGTVSWTFTDPDAGDSQSAYQVQADNNASFGSPEIDSGKTVSAATAYQLVQGILQYSTTYQARARVWDSQDAPSNWVQMSVCNGPPGNPSGCLGGDVQWRTPVHRYPSDVDFTWTPAKPRINEVVQFDDSTTTCYDNSNNPTACNTYAWTWGDGTPNGSGPTPTHTYTSAGQFTSTMKVTDQAGFACPVTPLGKVVNIVKPVPQWKEVTPR